MEDDLRYMTVEELCAEVVRLRQQVAWLLKEHGRWRAEVTRLNEVLAGRRSDSGCEDALRVADEFNPSGSTYRDQAR